MTFMQMVFFMLNITTPTCYDYYVIVIMAIYKEQYCLRAVCVLIWPWNYLLCMLSDSTLNIYDIDLLYCFIFIVKPYTVLCKNQMLAYITLLY